MIKICKICSNTGIFDDGNNLMYVNGRRSSYNSLRCYCSCNVGTKRLKEDKMRHLIEDGDNEFIYTVLV